MKPRLTTAPSYRGRTSYSVTIQFRQFDDNIDNTDLTKYQIQLKKGSDAENSWAEKTTLLQDNTLTHRDVTLSGLQYNTWYNIRVVVVYDDGIEEIHGFPSPSATIKTNCKGNFNYKMQL